MIVLLILLCHIIALINSDVESDIRSEEEKRHNTTVSTYFKAALGGALNTLFPKVTDQERAEAEKILADSYPIGDPSRPLPDSEEKIEVNLCRNHREKGKTVLTYARKRWPTHLLTQVTIRLTIYAIGDKNDWYCDDAVNRNIYTSNASVINSYVNEINLKRNKFIDNNMVVAYGNNTLHKLALLCCSFWDFKVQSLKSVESHPKTKHFLEDYINGYSGAALRYLCIHHSENSNACANLVIPPPPADYPRPTSVFASCIEALLKLTSITN